MFIEELVIDGFKSYSTRTPVGPFDKQFNAITGLNGSGKSNILDSICFVLGISNLSQVRVGNLSELVYKQGQAGVTKASVTVIFNNSKKSSSPVGYEMHDKITITRQIVIGGKNRYLLNSHNVQANQIQNLFHSVQLNVNNPHFLIMQGRITKVINMKPQETLGMIEEAAGTRMYENKKVGALRTLEKKQMKVDEINRLLAEEITPTLEKLQKDRANYMLWMSNNNEVERLSRFCTAYEYVQVQSRLDSKNTQLEEMEVSLKQHAEDIKSLAERDLAIQKEIKERTGQRDQARSSALKKLEEEHSKLSKDMVATESKLKNRGADIEGDMAGRQKAEKHIEDLKKQVLAKEKAMEKEKAKYDTLANEKDAHEKAVEKAQWQMQALSAGMSAEAAPEGAEAKGSLREQLLATQTRLSEMDSDHKKKAMTVKALREALANTQKVASKGKQDGVRLSQEKASAEELIGKMTAELQKCDFDPQRYAAIDAAARQGDAALQSLQDRIDSLRAHIGGIDFQYQDPWKNFDRSLVKGVVAKLFHLKPENAAYARALEVCAGGRLFFVVVNNEETGKALLEKGQLRKRVTIIPLNKIVDPTIRPQVVRQAREIMPEGGETHLALEIIGCDKEVQSAMKYVFGSFLVCDSPETAKKVTFHPNVRVRSVTKDGDLYDPAGMITGGSAPRGGGILLKLQELQQLEGQIEKHQGEYAQAVELLERMKGVASHYNNMDRELKCKQHELALILDRIQGSESAVAEQEMQKMQDTCTQFEEDIKGMPDEKKRLEKETKSLEKEIKSLDSGREGRIAFLEKQVEELKGTLKQQASKLQAQHEKSEQAIVELDVLKAEAANCESKEQDSAQSHEQLKAEVAELKNVYDQQSAKFEEVGLRLETMKGELKSLEEALGGLTEELSTVRTGKEEKELEQKRLSHKVQTLQKEDKEAHHVVARMEKQHPWIEKEKTFFGKACTDYDFEANDYQKSKARLDELNAQQKHLSKHINKKAMAMFEKAEQEYKDLLEKRDIILNDKQKIEHVIKDLDQKKGETLRRTWLKVNKDFGSIFGTLLTNANAKLEPPAGMSELEGLQISVAFNGVWKNGLTELSGGQRSLLALSLVLALLLFKPAPMYILDEIDSALDLSHTQNIGHMIRQHFPHSQFIIVSLKEGMFNNANVLFRTRFIDGTSTVGRYAIRDGADAIEGLPEDALASEKDKAPQQSRKRKATA